MFKYILNIILSLAVLVFSFIRMDDGGTMIYIIMALAAISLVANLILMIKNPKR
ncbi:hypothetical protein PCCS19_50450 [Paenibacillus sp. CCS19]|uniref:hypothetical protein n=1 Tax=Paenibacillus sp. CCS19 TaxID=3158387 RepID=UPI00255D9D9A|nr:hypothetical protein [Paenibacillus cellulosilyticus]GMK41986.1 hypothetical protein PCCS19_50450 [Paenibacillus cellulosilyticus]